ncbi:amino acid-binding protein [Methanosarcinales archaeon]|nr:MAG: amino acid-binding protein [Methanosarcinales archaeon]
MWGEILEKFNRFPAQQRVISLLLENGFGISPGGRIRAGKIEISHTDVARAVGVDRRVIDATIKNIMADESLRTIFENMRAIPLLRDLAPLLNLGVIVIEPHDATDVGILGAVAGTIASHGLSIRQAVSDDPVFTDEPKLTIVTDPEIPPELIRDLKKIPAVKGVTIY